MKRFLPVLIIFIVLNVFVTLPLYFFNYLDFSLLSFIFSCLFSLIWILLIVLNEMMMQKKDVNAAFKVIGTNMGLKLGMSAICLVLLYQFDMIQNELSLVIFAGYYFFYTMAIARFTTKNMDELEK